MKISRFIKRFKEDKKEFSFKVAWSRLVLDCPYFKWEYRRDQYEKKIYNYLEKNYKSRIDEFAERYNPSKMNKGSNIVWVMWWQGVDGMPPIVRKCYEQLLSVKGDKRVILVTKDNYKDYLEMPDYMIQRLEKNDMKIAHFADVYRIGLLAKHGGVWIDATMFVDKLPDILFQREFYTLRADGLFPNFIFRGSWSSFLLAANKTNTIFMECLYYILLEYWSEHSMSIDYLAIDYFILLLKNNVERIKEVLLSVPENRNFYILNTKINDEYIEEEFNNILNASSLQKLTYRKELKEFTEDGKMTNYSYILKRK